MLTVIILHRCKYQKYQMIRGIKKYTHKIPLTRAPLAYIDHITSNSELVISINWGYHLHNELSSKSTLLFSPSSSLPTPPKENIPKSLSRDPAFYCPIQVLRSRILKSDIITSKPLPQIKYGFALKTFMFPSETPLRRHCKTKI